MSQAPETVSTAAFAGLVGLTPRRIQQLVSEKVLPSGGHGKIALALAIQAFVKWRVENEIRAFRFERDEPRKRDGGDLDLEGERTRKLRLENDIAERKAIPEHVFEAACDLLVGPALVDLLSLPARVTDDIRLRRVMDDEIDGIRTRHADRLVRMMRDVNGGEDLAADEDPEGGEAESTP